MVLLSLLVWRYKHSFSPLNSLPSQANQHNLVLGRFPFVVAIKEETNFRISPLLYTQVLAQKLENKIKDTYKLKKSIRTKMV